MNLRGLCVCSFGLRTIAVLMSLFPSLGISSFLTAVCCDGENEYTTLHAPCQPLFAFFLDFFAFFFRGVREACHPEPDSGSVQVMACIFYTGPSRASGTGMPGFTQYLYKFWHAAFTRPFDRLGDRTSAECRGRMPPQGGCFGIFARLNASLDRSRIKFGMTGFIRDDGLCWGWQFLQIPGRSPG